MVVKRKGIAVFIIMAALFFFVPLFCKGDGGSDLHIINLRCEMLVNPEGIDVIHPRLSWEIVSKERNIIQEAYQVLVASSEEKLNKNIGDIWNSGKINSAHSVNVIYSGRKLKSTMDCFWKVKIWTNKGESIWSETAHWSMGLLQQNSWKAKWIGLDRSFPWDSAHSKFSRLSARYFRKEFNVRKNIRRAMVYVTGLGYYQIYINGHRIGNQVLTPAPTDYTKSILYNTYDVTHEIKSGENVIGTILGNGYFFTMRQNYKPYKIKNFGYPKMLLQLEIQYEDGSRQRIVSDTTWQVTADGPIRTNNIYDGEDYDARKEMKGWNTTSFNDNNWLPVQLVSSPGGKLDAQINEKVKVMDTIKPASIHYLRPGVYIMDMGQNMAGWIKMKVQGEGGRQVTLRFAETLQANGEIATANLRDAKATEVYTLSGNGEEVWQPSFIYQGFRYVEITNYPGVPVVSDFTGEVVYDGLTTTGSFKTSNQTINQIYHNAFWSICSNYKGIPVDCPQRNERMPWLGDRAVSPYGESFIFDNEKLYAQWLNDIERAQTKEGVIPDVAPGFWHYYTDDITWPSTYFLVAEMLYRQYGDLLPVEKHYASMKKWLNHISEKYMTNYLVHKDKYGDWCMPPAHLELIHAIDSSRITNGELIATAYYYHVLTIMEGFAQVLHHPSDAQQDSLLAEKIKQAFNQKYLNTKTWQYSNNTVTANILPLYFGMTPPADRQKVFKNVADEITRVYHNHISTGVIGTSWLMRVLTAYGRPDIAYDIAATLTYPGWGYMTANGATTTWELWNGNKANPEMSSRNHVMLLGDLIVWLYEDIAGIKSNRNAPGFIKIIMKPELIDSLHFVNASYHSIHGLIKSDWRRSNQHFYWNISVPGNTRAVVYIPTYDIKTITESGKDISHSKSIDFLEMKGGRAVFEIGSGNYAFESVL